MYCIMKWKWRPFSYFMRDVTLSALMANFCLAQNEDIIISYLAVSFSQFLIHIKILYTYLKTEEDSEWKGNDE